MKVVSTTQSLAVRTVRAEGEPTTPRHGCRRTPPPRHRPAPPDATPATDGSHPQSSTAIRRGTRPRAGTGPSSHRRRESSRHCDRQHAREEHDAEAAGVTYGTSVQMSGFATMPAEIRGPPSNRAGFPLPLIRRGVLSGEAGLLLTARSEDARRLLEMSLENPPEPQHTPI